MLWQDMLRMNDCMGVEALSHNLGLADVAMFDGFAVVGEDVYATFDLSHPYHKIKEAQFGGYQK